MLVLVLVLLVVLMLVVVAIVLVGIKVVLGHGINRSENLIDGLQRFALFAMPAATRHCEAAVAADLF